MTFSHIAFQPVADMTVIDANLHPDARATLLPGDQRQFLYVCEPSANDNPFVADQAMEKARQSDSGNLGLGKFDLVWQTTGGEQGKLQTALMSRKLPQQTWSAAYATSPNFQVSLLVEGISQPQPLRTEQPFDVAFKVRLQSLREEVRGEYLVQPIYYHRSASHEVDLATAQTAVDSKSSASALPAPVPMTAAHPQDATLPDESLVYLGEPLICLGTATLEDQVFDFTLPYLGTDDGLINVGGLRILHRSPESQVVRLAEYPCVAQIQVAA